MSNRGVIPLSWTLDHTGPMTKNVEDAAMLLNVIAGYDAQDPTTVDVPVPDYTTALGAATAKLRLGIPRKPFFENLDPDVGRAVDAAIEVLRRLAASVVDVELPPAGTPALVWGPEIYAYHSKWMMETPEKYQAATRAAIERDGTIPAWQHAQARRGVEIARREIRKTFASVDLLVTPTMKTPAPLLPAGPGAPGVPAGAGGEAAPPPAEAAATPRSSTGLRAADDFGAVRVLERGPADRPANQRRPLGRGDGADAGPRLRTGHGVETEESSCDHVSRSRKWRSELLDFTSPLCTLNFSTCTETSLAASTA